MHPEAARLNDLSEKIIGAAIKISGLRLGLLLNFNVRNLSRQGIVRKVNRFPE
jgi:hypothetical protein